MCHCLKLNMLPLSSSESGFPEAGAGYLGSHFLPFILQYFPIGFRSFYTVDVILNGDTSERF
jgi:hypothetical protein